jgi:predicted CXXCH cytochrome family protein
MRSEGSTALRQFRWLFFIAAGLLSLTAIGVAADWWTALPADTVATYVGRDSCAKCHQSELKAWTGSDHDLAMDLARDETVLGDFNNIEFTHQGVTSRLFRRDKKFFVNTEGPTGEMQDFEIKYTFGVRPLQQYMVEFPDGRVQVLRISWDTAKKRWFHLDPPDVKNEHILPDDPLHWTGVAQNWNHTCADCHSTNLQKNYDLATNTFHTTFSEIDVSCEACHGPGSTHVELAEAKSLFWDRNLGYGLARLKGADTHPQLETCAKCHSRRNQIHGDFRPGSELLNSYEVSNLHENLYHPDGQIQDEVYEYGSFLQSKMYRKNIRCSDCHDPHSTKLKAVGNQLCAKCHQPGKFDVPSHHHHAPGSKGAQCVECHMPTTTYMDVDPRRDHSLRVPRPDLTVSLGTPNACNKCHTKPTEDAEWAADKVVTWFGEKRPTDPHYAPAIAAGRAHTAEGAGLLRDALKQKETPEIVQATAIELLSSYPDGESQAVVRKALKSSVPQIRTAAAKNYHAPAEELKHALTPMLNDPVRLVRITAARRLVEVPLILFTSAESKALDAALNETRAAELMVADRAGAHLNLGKLYEQLAHREARARHTQQANDFISGAIQEYQTAIELEPYMAESRSTLAELLQQNQGDPQEIRRLREEELKLFARDARLLPKNALVHNRLGLLHYLLGQLDEAEAAIRKACELEPQSYDYRLNLTLLYEKRKQTSQAIESAEKLLEIRPEDPVATEILRKLKAMGD